MNDLNVTPSHKSHLGLYIYDYKGNTSRVIILDSTVRERLHHFPFAILSDNCDNLGLVHTSHFCCVEFNPIKCGRNATADSDIEFLSNLVR